MNSIDRFTKRAKQVFYYAQEEARYFNHPYVGTEHILLGLTRDQDHVAGHVLDKLGVKHAQARSAVKFIVGYGKVKRNEDLELTAGTKRMIEYALEEGRKLNHHYVGTEHLLLGLVRKGEGVAAGVLEIMGVSLEQVRTSVLRNLHLDSSSGMEYWAHLKQKTPYLDALSTDLTGIAEAGRLDPLVSHQKELEQLIYISSRLSRNNTVLIGDVCVGKAAIVEGLAQRIITGNVPESIKGKRVIKLDINALMAGVKNGSQLEERLHSIRGELQQSRSILFINDLYILSGSNKNKSDVIKILKLGLSQSKFQLIVAMAVDEYAKYIERNHLLRRYFQSLIVTTDN